VSLLPADITTLLTARAEALGPFGQRAEYLSSTPSTNDVAADLAVKGAAEGTWVLAEEQSAGRGRRGRAWASPPGAGLYLSVIFRPQPAAGVQPSAQPGAEDSRSSAPAVAAPAPAAMPMLAPALVSAFATASVATGPASAGRATSLLTLMAGVAVVTGVRAATGLTPALKWPNDLMIEPPASRQASPAAASRWRKLSGMLAEASATGGALQFIVLGIGLNLTPAAYPPDVQARATSLEGELGRPIDRALVLVEILSALAAGRRQLLAGDDAAILARWREWSPSSVGRRVRWQAGDAPRSGVTRGIDADGALLVQTPDGATERIIAGELEWE
jgi:BirA family biotin operon repressor/biotin-[acetyl-CoA-carboxylase] ligase